MDEGGLLGLTQQLSSLGREMNLHQGSNPVSPSANPFGLSTPVAISPQPIYSVPHNSPANGVIHVSPARRALFNSTVSKHLFSLTVSFMNIDFPLLQFSCFKWCYYENHRTMEWSQISHLMLLSFT